MSLAIRRSRTFVALNGSDAEDFDVLDTSRRIGRIYRRKIDPEEWCWSISAVGPRGISGRSPTRFLALQNLADTLYAFQTQALRLESQNRPGSHRRSIQSMALLFYKASAGAEETPSNFVDAAPG